jgi:glycosyltransferase involved in cell wall biosynthesis
LPKKVLLITFNYPPNPAATPSPICEWVKYLPDFGWEPFVLTASPDRRSDHLSAAAGDSIYMVQHNQLFEKLIRLRSKYSHNSLPFKLLNYFLINCLLYPDDKCGWFKKAVARGQSIVRDNKIDLILSSGAPWTAFWVANRLSRKMKIPWIAHYRDPWTQPTSQKIRSKWIFQTAASRILERYLIDSALFCLHASDRWAGQLQRMTGKEVHWIPNGFDSGHFNNAEQISPDPGVFTLSYVGTLHFPQQLDPFFEGFSLFIAAENVDPNSCVLNFVGTSDFQFIRDRYPSLIPFTRQLPYMKKQMAVNYMLKSHILLLFLSDDNGWYPAKLYDYLASNRFILASPNNNGVINRILEQTGAGVVLDQPDEIAMQLAAYLKRFRRGQDLKSNNDPQTVRELERRHLTEKLSSILNEITLHRSNRLFAGNLSDNKNTVAGKALI